MATRRRVAGPVSRTGRGRRSRGDRSEGRALPATEPVRLRIDSIAAGGEGVGRLPDGRVAFVHRTAPGDLAEIAVGVQRERWARGRLLRVLEPSAERRPPPCRFYERCGGCTLEHLRYAAQLRAKGRIVADAFGRIGGVEADPPEVVASPREQRYRNRVSFALRRLGGVRVVAGFHELGNAERIVDIDGSCLLPEEPISRVWDRLRAAWGAGAERLPPGDRLRLTLRANAAEEVSLLVEGGDAGGKPAELLAETEGLVSIWHRPGDAGPVLLAGAPGLPERWGEDALELSGAAFLQVNRGAAALLEAEVLQRAGEVTGLRVVDAYCGVGLHARRLARAGARVVGIELDPDAVREARRGAPGEVRFLAGSVEALLPAQLPADLVVLNPPRAGVAPEVAAALVASPPGQLLYISCDPATLARDARRLAERFELQSVRCFDLFPQTAHVETVAAFRLRFP